MRAARHVMSVGLLLAGACALLLACDDAEPEVTGPTPLPPRPPPGGDKVVYHIGDSRMTVDGLRAHIASLDAFQRIRMRSRKVRREYIDKLIDFELFAHVAQQRGLHRTADAERVRKEAMVQKLREALYAENGARLQDVGPDVIEAFLQEHPELRPAAQGANEAADAYQLRKVKALRKVRDLILKRQRDALWDRVGDRLVDEAGVKLNEDALSLLRVPALPTPEPPPATSTRPD